MGLKGKSKKKNLFVIWLQFSYFHFSSSTSDRFSFHFRFFRSQCCLQGIDKKKEIIHIFRYIIRNWRKKVTFDKKHFLNLKLAFSILWFSVMNVWFSSFYFFLLLLKQICIFLLTFCWWEKISFSFFMVKIVFLTRYSYIECMLKNIEDKNLLNEFFCLEWNRKNGLRMMCKL